MRFLLGRCAAFAQETAGDHDRFEIGFDNQMAAELFHDDHVLDGAAAETAKLFGKGRGEQAELGELSPHFRTPAIGRLRYLAARLKIIFVAEQALHCIAEQRLFLGKRKIHL